MSVLVARLVDSRALRTSPVARSPRLARRTLIAGSSGIALAGVGSTLLIAGCDDPDETLAVLVLATIGAFSVSVAAYAINENVGGTIELINRSARDQSGDVRLGLLDTTGSIVDGGQAHYEVKSGFANVYEWTGLRSDRAGEHHARAESALNVADSSAFVIA